MLCVLIKSASFNLALFSTFLFVVRFRLWFGIGRIDKHTDRERSGMELLHYACINSVVNASVIIFNDSVFFIN